MSRLTLTRKDGECIQIGKDIIITVNQLRRGYTKVTIEAPRELKVLRSELEHHEVFDGSQQS